ncbi:MAG: imidazolonepropionase [Blastocatellia bacterium]|nr:imidazolonepropionase [Blastocatellia bacterium]
MEKLVITNIKQLVTLAGSSEPRTKNNLSELSIIENGAIVCENGLINWVGEAQSLPQFTDCQFIDAREKIVTPGFVDAHTHPVFAGSRENEYELRILGKTYQEIALAGGGIRSSVRRTRGASCKDLLAESRSHINLLLQHGTTTAEAKSGYGLSLEDEIKSLEVIKELTSENNIELVPTFLGAHEIPDEFRNNRDSYINLLTEKMIPAVAKENLAEYCDIFCESHVFSVDEARKILNTAKEYGLKLRLHADQLTLSGGAKLAAELNAITADHLEHIDEESIDALKQAGVMAVLLPGSVFHLGLKQYPPARKMIDSGLAIVIATDFNPGSSPTPSLSMIMSLACTQMRLTPAEALTACTINAAYSLGRGDKIGSLELGKQADLVIFDCQDYRQIPYFFGTNLVNTVIKRGNIVYRSSR